jgi:hypothetical protein
MSNDNQDYKKSFFDLSQYSDRTRKIVFGAICAVLVGVVVVAMFIISPSVDPDEPTATDDTTATQAPVANETTEPSTSEPVAPDVEPTDEEQEYNEQQKQIIEESNKRAEEQADSEVYDNEDSVANAAAIKDKVQNGILAFCNIAPGETTEQRKAKMQPYFSPDSGLYSNPTEFYYQRECSVEAMDEPQLAENGNISVIVGVAWSGVLAESDAAAEADFTQYTVLLDENGIISLND